MLYVVHLLCVPYHKLHPTQHSNIATNKTLHETTQHSVLYSVIAVLCSRVSVLCINCVFVSVSDTLYLTDEQRDTVFPIWLQLPKLAYLNILYCVVLCIMWCIVKSVVLCECVVLYVVLVGYLCQFFFSDKTDMSN